ncbi:MAG: DUF6516 family protein [Anaerolineae bacterium]|nr:DUF6516 family protein [Anaerolineae bacterium]
MRAKKIIKEYLKDFAGILDNSGIVEDRSQLKANYSGNHILAGGATRHQDEPSGIIFKDGSFLSFIVIMDIVDDEPIMPKYTFRYTNREKGIIFRYDKDPRSAGSNILIDNSTGNKTWHPECHLHFQDRDDPRYKTHETNFEEIIDFIKTSF